nr:hypothetical protein Itr_chr11CG01210 [Ipomoea trifida]
MESLPSMKIGGEEVLCNATRRDFLRLCSGGSDLRIAEGESGGTVVERVFIGGVATVQVSRVFPPKAFLRRE